MKLALNRTTKASGHDHRPKASSGLATSNLHLLACRRIGRRLSASTDKGDTRVRNVVLPLAFIVLCNDAGMSSLRADDVIVNGLHCNSMCQSWLGVHDRSAETPAAVLPVAAAAAVTSPKPRPNVKEPISVPSPPIASPANVRTASREDGLALVSSQPATTRDRARQVGDRFPARAGKKPVKSVPVHIDEAEKLPVMPVQKPSLYQVSLPPNLGASEGQQAPARPQQAVGEGGTPAVSQQELDDRPERSLAPIPRDTLVNVNPGMEPGLKSLPRLGDLVAVHGTIIVDTADDQAVAQRQLARIIKATTRPKQFKTGLADQFPSDSPGDQKVVGEVH